jgi:hypothetical protein
MKFSIRDLFLVTVIVALAVAWWVEHYRAKSALLDAIEAKERIAQVEEELDNYGLEIYWGGKGVGPLLFRPDDKPYYSIPGGFTNKRPSPNSSAPTPNPPKP